ncbi:MAG TPA: hypothetical protein ENG66_00990 [Thermococcus sp.]|nr:hypothetical protein [Thermococcus sp.]
MYVEVLKYSVTYPTGPQRPGDIIELTRKEARYYMELGWVRPIHRKDLKFKKSRHILEDRNLVKDLSVARMRRR